MIHHVHETRRLLNSLESDRRKEGVTRDFIRLPERKTAWMARINNRHKNEKSARARDFKTNFINELPHGYYT